MKNKRNIILIIILVAIAIITAIAIKLNLKEKEIVNLLPEENKIEENIIVENKIENTIINNQEENLVKLKNKGEIANKKSKYIDENGNSVVVPEGYAIIKDSPNVENGLVISDIEDDDLNNIKGGNQFVWIPVTTPMLDVSNYTNEIDINNAIAESIENKKYPMAIKLSDGNYRGVLYRFETINEGTTIKVNFIAYSENETEREPANLEQSIDNSTNISNWTQYMYQQEYNQLVESIIKDKGFWVGRYETSLSSTGIAQSQKSKKAMTNISWYQMYSVQKTLNTKSTTSHMIWGSQWDQIMILLKNVYNSNGINSNYYILDSTNMGNYLDLEIPSEDKEPIKQKGEAIRFKTGEISNSLVYNIYDLAGNVWEWTMEANFSSTRTVRGGYCAYNGATYPVSARFSFKADYSGDKIENIGSRMTLITN